MSMDWKYKRSDFKRPPVQLEHADVTLKFYEDKIDGEITLHLFAREKVETVILDANAIDIKEVEVDSKKSIFTYDREKRKLFIPLSSPLKENEKIKIHCAATSFPDDIHLEGIYKDTTPASCPQQYVSQCQQFGFQRILPIIDDCTAKCTFTTTLEGDEKYTHLISNGNIVSDTISNGRRTVVYENRHPMAPYLFLACAGTWETLSDEVEYPDTHQKIKLEYLVPPGHLDGAKIPMEILKESILFQHDLLGYSYPYETYRTICMEKSLYGGMENTGNTTIITEAALIDGTINDKRLVYAYAIIPHEYEHNHCGSSVTMESVFDMWLNEGYTVNVERAFLHHRFGKTFMRATEIDDMRRTGGPFSEEESHSASSVVREGVNDPDEVVDAVTYVKSPEVLNTLENLIGKESYKKATELYFKRYNGSNANTDQFLACFDETVKTFADGSPLPSGGIKEVMFPWLFETLFPTIDASWEWKKGKLSLLVSQDGNFTTPVSWCAVKDGKDIKEGMIILDKKEKNISVDLSEKPDFISWNRDGRFYGVLNAKGVSAQTLQLQARCDNNGLNRVEAMRKLYDLAIQGDATPWLDVYEEVFKDATIDLSVKAMMLAFPSEPLDRKMIGNVVENAKRIRELKKAAAEKISLEQLVAALENLKGRDLPSQILSRACKKSILAMIAELNSAEAWSVLKKFVKTANNITDKLNALDALISCDYPERYQIIEEEGKMLRQSLNGYSGYLSIIASDRHDDVFENIKREESREGWSIKHPGLSRALYCSMAKNENRIYTPEGLEWIKSTIEKYAKVSEYNAIRLLVAIQGYRDFPPKLSQKCKQILESLSNALPSNEYPFINGKLKSLLS